MTRLVRFACVSLTAVTLTVALLVVPRADAQAPNAQAPSAQAPQPKPEMVENCPGLIASDRPRVMPASLQFALNPEEVRISYAGHSTFLIESPQQVRIATDYNDYVRPRVLPDIATMNHAHDSHFTDTPAPGIRHVLRG